MSIPRIHHAALVVPDLAAAVQFYCEFLAMDISFRTSWTAPSPEIDQLVGIPGSSADVVMLKGASSGWNCSSIAPLNTPTSTQAGSTLTNLGCGIWRYWSTMSCQNSTG